MSTEWPALSKAQIAQCVAERLEALRTLPRAVLETHPASEGEHLEIAGRPVARWTYVERRSHDELWVVVQLGADRAPSSSLGQSFADGFRISSDGAMSAISAPAIYEWW